MSGIRNLGLFMIAAAALPRAALAQGLTGSVIAAGTGAPVPNATVVAFQKTASHAAPSAAYKSSVDQQGRFSIAAPAGQYRICVFGAAPYLDPCQWGGSTDTTAGSQVNLTLQKGAPLILRVHDRDRLMPQAESVHGAAISVRLSAPGVPDLPIPMISDMLGIRDYGILVPFDTPITLFAKGNALHLKDKTGSAVSDLGVPVQVSAADFKPLDLAPRLARMFPPPSAKVIHVYASAHP